jgi:hypothetical protein
MIIVQFDAGINTGRDSTVHKGLYILSTTCEKIAQKVKVRAVVIKASGTGKGES